MRQKLKRNLSSQTHFSWIKLDTIVCVVRYLTLRNSAHIQYYGVAYSRYSVNEQMWIMRHARKVDFLATSRAPQSSLLLGSHLWVVHNDNVKCSSEGGTSYMTNLTLHACKSEQFACDNAFCITIKKRCDAKEDCSDGSDEQNCGKLIIREGYKKELTPIPETDQDVVVDLFIELLDIEITEQTEIFTSRVAFTRNWFDWRLSYKNLKNECGTKMNVLLPKERGALWYPYLAFYNVRSMDDIKKTNIRDVLEVIPNNEFTFMAEDNNHIFDGSKNALSLKREHNVNWKCDYVYHWYPFDTQVCPMEFAITVSNTDVYPRDLQYNRNISLTRYTLNKIHMCKSVINNMKAIIVEVTLGRPIINFLLTVFVPTFLLIIISFSAYLIFINFGTPPHF